MATFTVYMILFGDYLYTGQTNNLARRLREHGQDARLLYREDYPERWAAVRRERQLKGWTREKKEALARGDRRTVRRLAVRRVKG
jgi:predicted GIY-YIG superfamily endonuclease